MIRNPKYINTEKINAALANIESQRQSVMADAQAQSTRLIAEARDIAKLFLLVHLAFAAAFAGVWLRMRRRRNGAEKTPPIARRGL